MLSVGSDWRGGLERRNEAWLPQSLPGLTAETNVHENPAEDEKEPEEEKEMIALPTTLLKSKK